MDYIELANEFADRLRAEGLAGIVIVIDPKEIDDGEMVNIKMSTSRVLDIPGGYLTRKENGHYTTKDDYTHQELCLTCAIMLSMCKKLAKESDFLFDKIDQDFLIANADQFL